MASPLADLKHALRKYDRAAIQSTEDFESAALEVADRAAVLLSHYPQLAQAIALHERASEPTFYVVGLTAYADTGQPRRLAVCATPEEASEYIGTLRDHEDGRYYIDACTETVVLDTYGREPADERLARGRRLRDEHPHWSLRMILTALDHGEDSDEFRDAKLRADTFDTWFDATGGWMGLS